MTKPSDLKSLRRRFITLEESRIELHYPARKSEPAYALYSSGWDRFLTVDHLELSAVMHAAKLLSSKLPLIVFILPANNNLNRADCLEWTIREKTSRLSDGQTPVLKSLENLESLIRVGPPTNDLESAVDDQGFAAFVLRATYAARLTDMLLNTADHAFYLRFFEQPLEALPFRKHFDETRWPNGFMTAIEKVLYLSSSVDEALFLIAKLLPSEIKNAILKNYAQTFYSFLGWSPAAIAERST